MSVLNVYKSLTAMGGPVLRSLLANRIHKGKEIAGRLGEREGKPSMERPAGSLVWVHAASVGESQSALILIERLMQTNKPPHILMTTGTISSAAMMQKNLPSNVTHQFYPLDHPRWVDNFLNHWHPDLVLWMESELWPNMLNEIKKRGIPAILVNARLSEKSFRRWLWIKPAIREILSAFSLILAQSPAEARRYRELGAPSVTVTGNLKYSAKPLPYDDNALQDLLGAVGQRFLWLFASTHDGEESMACRIHENLKSRFSNLLTIIVPRHPDRRADITAHCREHGLSFVLRGETKTLPDYETDIYIADTFGELGLFYRLAPMACIGRSFSYDGGGGHNPIEAAQLHCAVLYGPNVQYQKDIYEEMSGHNAAIGLQSENELENLLRELLQDKSRLEKIQRTGIDFTRDKSAVIETVMEALRPWLDFSPDQTRAMP